MYTHSSDWKWIGLLLAMLAMFPSLVWIRLDQHVWPWDQAWYAETSVDLFATLIHKPASWFTAMQQAMGQKPPLLPWVGQFFVPFGVVLGDVDFALLLISVLAHCVSLYLLWFTARSMVPDNIWAAIFAVLLTASAPMFVAMSHEYLTEPLLSVIVVASYLIAARARQFGLFLLTGILILLVMSALAIKATTVVYCGFAWIFILYAMWERWQAGDRFRLVIRGNALILSAATLTTIFTLAWYFKNFERMMVHVRAATLSDIADAYGSRSDIITKFKFWLSGGNESLFVVPYLFPVLLLLVGLVIFSNWRKAVGAPDIIKRERWIFRIVFFGFLHTIFLVILLSIQVNEEKRFFAPIIPVFSLVLAWTFSRLPRQGYVLPLLSVAVLVQLVAVHLVAHGRIAKFFTLPHLAVITIDPSKRQTATQIVDRTCPRDLQYRYVVVGIEEPQMNANSLAYQAAKFSVFHGFRCYYTGLGYAETDPQKALDRVDSLNTTFLVLPVESSLPKNPNYLNKVVVDVFNVVSQSNRYSREGEALGNYNVYRRAP